MPDNEQYTGNDEFHKSKSGLPTWGHLVIAEAIYPRFNDDGLVVDEHAKRKLFPKEPDPKGKGYKWVWRHGFREGWRAPEGMDAYAFAVSHGSTKVEGGADGSYFTGQAKNCEDCADLVALGKLPGDWLDDSYWYVGGSAEGRTPPDYAKLFAEPVLAICEGPSDADAFVKYTGIPAITACRAINGPTPEQASRFKAKEGHKGRVLIVADRDSELTKGSLPGLKGASATIKAIQNDGRTKSMVDKALVTVVLPPEGYKDAREWLEVNDFTPFEELQEGDKAASVDDLEKIPAGKFGMFEAKAINKLKRAEELAANAEHRKSIIAKGGREAEIIERLGNWTDSHQQFFYSKEDEDSGLRLDTLARAIKSAGELATDEGYGLYYYWDGLWRTKGEMEVKRRAKLLLKGRFNTQHAGNAVEWFGIDYPTLTDDRINTDYINVKNGLLNWKTLELIPHDPEIYVPNQIPVNWNPEAKCPEYDAWLEQVVPGDVIPVMYEIDGLALYNGNPLQKAIGLVGKGSNGKGTYMRHQENLVGIGNVSNVSPQELVDDKFMAAEVHHKLINSVGDVDPKAMENPAIFKKMTGNDRISAQRKRGHPFTFVCRALLISSYNEFPKTLDHTAGYYRRWLWVRFIGDFLGSADNSFEERINTPEELEGALVKAVLGLRNLMGQGKFSESESIEAATRAFRINSDSVRLFVNSAIEATEGDDFLYRADIYHMYETSVSKNGGKPLSNQGDRFWDRFETALRDVTGAKLSREFTRNGDRGHKGLKFSEAFRRDLEDEFKAMEFTRELRDEKHRKAKREAKARAKKAAAS